MLGLTAGRLRHGGLDVPPFQAMLYCGVGGGVTRKARSNSMNKEFSYRFGRLLREGNEGGAAGGGGAAAAAAAVVPVVDPLSNARYPVAGPAVAAASEHIS